MIISAEAIVSERWMLHNLYNYCHGTFCLIKAAGPKICQKSVFVFLFYILLPYSGNIWTIYVLEYFSNYKNLMQRLLYLFIAKIKFSDCLNMFSLRFNDEWNSTIAKIEFRQSLAKINHYNSDIRNRVVILTKRNKRSWRPICTFR